MTRFVRNPDGAVHSVPDDFEFPTIEGGAPAADWEHVTETEASAQLLGSEPDPAVEAVRLHDLADSPVAEVVSTDQVGAVPEVSPVEAASEVPVEPEAAPAVEAEPVVPEVSA
jgi:hypothetical protein